MQKTFAYLKICAAFGLFVVLSAPVSIMAAEIDFFNQQLLDKAFSAIDKKKDSQAEGFLSKFLEAYPNHPDALLAYARLCVRQNKFADADVAYSRLLRASSSDENVLYEFGLNKWRLKGGYEAQEALFRARSGKKLTAEQKQQIDATLADIYNDWSVFRVMKEREDLPAQERFHSAHIAANPDGAVVAYALRGFVLQRQGQKAAAEQDFNKAIAIGGMEEKLNSGVMRSLEGLRKDRERREQAALWEEVKAKVQNFEDKKDYQGLERYYSELIAAGKLPAFSLSRRANLRLNAGNLDGANDDFNAALQASPSKGEENYIRKGLKKLAQLKRQSDGGNPAGGDFEAKLAKARSVLSTSDGPNRILQEGVKSWERYEGYEAEQLLFLALSSGRLDAHKTATAKANLAQIYSDWDVFADMKELGDNEAQERFQTYYIDKDPEKASVSYALRGFIRHRMKNLLGAEHDFEKALTIGKMEEGLTASVQNSLGIVQNQRANKVSVAAKPSGSSATKQPYVGAWDYFKRASSLMEQGSYKQAAKVLERSKKVPNNADERALWHWHHGEALWRNTETETAAKDFERALPGLKIPFYRSGALVRLAEFNAEKGNTEKASAYASEAARIYPEPWRLSQISGIYMKMKQPEKAVENMRRAIKNERDPLRKADIYRNMAGMYNSMQDGQNYLASLQEYVRLAQANRAKLSKAEEAQMLYYQGELLSAAGRPDEAIQSYVDSLSGLPDARKGGVYLTLANQMVQTGDNTKAEYYAEQYVELAPQNAAYNRQAAQIFDRTGNSVKAIDYSRKAFELSPDKNPEQLRSLAYMYRNNDDMDNFRTMHYQYIDSLYNQIELLGDAAPLELHEKLYAARKAQSASERSWGFNSYNFGSYRERDSRYFGFVHELFKDITIAKDIVPKVYAQFNGTYDSHSSGTWVHIPSGSRGKWRADSDIDDTMHAVLGVKIKPFKIIPQLAIGAEQVFGIADSDDEEFRLRLNYFRGWGDAPSRIGEPYWFYATTYIDTTYSLRYNAFRHQGNIHLGPAFGFAGDENFMLFSFGRIAWDYRAEGTQKGKRWGLEGGPGIGFKKYFGEDRYHAPRSSVSGWVAYVHGFSPEKPDGVALNLSISY